ncbi:DUF2735 domain-containing protein [Methylobacterium sp. WL9]|uniref:DUF2735 domain-containing protein n=2 Tax=Methylobacterium thuringiense TaxID=1003091 RepID=A0ABQ4TT76_9HYPH|nr:DUF2735 domain-containing protein [Methylobacterium sp. WL9]TXN22737.1 DUF2735 domain-containing protein [Methylobacterium sp. WL9]GJE57619.1 hypothetical protein EKPJFOCH_4137 [Methylobacterium thuringiense]
MSMSSHQESARIYQFVPKARMNPPALRDRTAPVIELMPPRLPLCEFGSGSYHEAAIQEDRSRKP